MSIVNVFFLWSVFLQLQAHRAHGLLLALVQRELVVVAVALVLQRHQLVVIAGNDAVGVGQVALHRLQLAHGGGQVGLRLAQIGLYAAHVGLHVRHVA